jgi:ketosteroid isomerase-like protein
LSQENVEVVLESLDAANRRDLDGLVATLSPDVEWEDAAFFSEPTRIYRGRAEVRKWFDRVITEPWEGFHIEVEEITEATRDGVLLGALLTTRGKGSGVETKLRGWFVLWVANGKITKRQVLLDRDEALEAAGLRE